MYWVENFVFCINDLKNEGHNINANLPNLSNANHIRKDKWYNIIKCYSWNHDLSSVSLIFLLSIAHFNNNNNIIIW